MNYLLVLPVVVGLSLVLWGWFHTNHPLAGTAIVFGVIVFFGYIIALLGTVGFLQMIRNSEIYDAVNSIPFIGH